MGHSLLLYLYFQEGSCYLLFFRFGLGTSFCGSKPCDPAWYLFIPLLTPSLPVILQRTANSSRSKPTIPHPFLTKAEFYLHVTRQWCLVAPSALNPQISLQNLHSATLLLFPYPPSPTYPRSKTEGLNTLSLLTTCLPVLPHVSFLPFQRTSMPTSICCFFFLPDFIILFPPNTFIDLRYPLQCFKKLPPLLPTLLSCLKPETQLSFF